MAYANYPLVDQIARLNQYLIYHQFILNEYQRNENLINHFMNSINTHGPTYIEKCKKFTDSNKRVRRETE